MNSMFNISNNFKKIYEKEILVIIKKYLQSKVFIFQANKFKYL